MRLSYIPPIYLFVTLSSLIFIACPFIIIVPKHSPAEEEHLPSFSGDALAILRVQDGEEKHRTSKVCAKSRLDEVDRGLQAQVETTLTSSRRPGVPGRSRPS